MAGITVAWSDTAGGSGSAYLPTLALTAGERLVIREGSGTSGAGVLYLGTGVNIPWSETSGGSAALHDAYGTGLDFIRWGGSSETPPAGVGWTESVAAPSPPDGSVLGRSLDGSDTDAVADLCVQAPSLGAANNACP